MFSDRMISRFERDVIELLPPDLFRDEFGMTSNAYLIKFGTVEENETKEN